jgi:hypothetical protein
MPDLVLLDGNPLEDIRNTQKISGVFMQGHYIDRQALDGLLQKVGTGRQQPDRANLRLRANYAPLFHSFMETALRRAIRALSKGPTIRPEPMRGTSAARALPVNIGTQLPGGPFPLPTRAVRESVHASAATTRPIARRVGGCCYVIDLHPTGCTVMRGTK